jgi:hypothetical protein
VKPFVGRLHLMTFVFSKEPFDFKT